LLGLVCAEAPEQPPIRLSIGMHDVALQVPEGWLHFDHGREHRFQRDIAQISLADTGPATREAYLREIGHARELFRRNQASDAQTQLDRLRQRSAFLSARQWQNLRRVWRIARDGGLELDVAPEDVEAAYSVLLDEVETLETVDLATIVERALPDLDHGAQRDVADQHPVMIDGRTGMRVETWDRLSHAQRQSYLFVLNDGNLLVARMELGRFEDMKPAFDALVDSLEIHPPPGAAS